MTTTTQTATALADAIERVIAALRDEDLEEETR